MMVKILLITGLLCLAGNAAMSQSRIDSVRPYTLIISPRINSAGYFPFSGCMLNHHVNFDFTVAFEKNNWGFFLFQSFDLMDNKSAINYFQPAAYKKFPIGGKLKLGVYGGYLFSQTNGFSDKGESDYFGALSQHWDITKKLRLENTMLFSDLTIQPKLINRLLLIYRINNMHIDFFLHERVVFETADISISAAMAIGFPKIKIADQMFIQPSVTYQRYVTQNRPGYALNDGLFVSVAFPIDLSR